MARDVSTPFFPSDQYLPLCYHFNREVIRVNHNDCHFSFLYSFALRGGIETQSGSLVNCLLAT